jgi:hypothetical protein
MPGEDTHAEDEQTPLAAEAGEEAEACPEARPEDHAEGHGEPPPESQREAEPETAGASRTSTSDWPDLDGYCDELRGAHAEWAERVSAVRLQLAQLQSELIEIASQQHVLGIAEDLERLNEAVLGGTAVAQTLRLGYGLERYLALFWPAALDPRPALARSTGDGEYRVEVYLHVGPDGKGRIRVEGAKRLEAPLPTSRARVRGVLLRAVQDPKLVEPGAASAEAPSDTDEREGHPEPDERMGDERPSAPRPGHTDEQVPPEVQVIPLGPSEEAQSKEESEQTHQSG